MMLYFEDHQAQLRENSALPAPREYPALQVDFDVKKLMLAVLAGKCITKARKHHSMACPKVCRPVFAVSFKLLPWPPWLMCNN